MSNSNNRPDPQDAYSHSEAMAYAVDAGEFEDWTEDDIDDECDPSGGYDEEDDDYEDDGQPTEYEEYQDLYGGDDWDYGQCDCDY